jgi:hypothetical protein
VTEQTAMIVMNLVTPKVATQLTLLFHNLASGLFQVMEHYYFSLVTDKTNGTMRFMPTYNCRNSKNTFYLETTGGKKFNQYLNVVNLINTNEN